MRRERMYMLLQKINMEFVSTLKEKQKWRWRKLAESF